MEKIIVYTDGGARNNPGPAAAGIVILNKEHKLLKKYSQYLGDDLTNNQAEYMAVIFALKKIKALFGKKKAKNLSVEIRTDSDLLAKQLNGKYKILDPKIQPLFLDIWNLKFDFREVKFSSIPREKNKEADRLVNEAIERKKSNLSLF
ncbi:ribonuclease HI family protein [bacterium]|nr:ribonuclease HI family protein [bacterium]